MCGLLSGSGEHIHSAAAPVSAATKGVKRIQIKEQLKSKPLSVVHRLLLSKKVEEAQASLDMGNFDDVPSLTRLQKMASENNVEEDLSPDYRLDLILTAESLGKKYGAGSFFIVSHIPFQVAWCTDNMAKVMMSVTEKLLRTSHSVRSGGW